MSKHPDIRDLEEVTVAELAKAFFSDKIGDGPHDVCGAVIEQFGGTLYRRKGRLPITAATYGEKVDARLAAEDDPLSGVEDQHRYPPSLLKATYDHFDYALQLTTGEIIHFTDAEIHGDWVRLTADEGPGGEGFERGLEVRWKHSNRSYFCPRGIDVRVDQIVWCADAPGGS